MTLKMKRPSILLVLLLGILGGFPTSTPAAEDEHTPVGNFRPTTAAILTRMLDTPDIIGQGNRVVVSLNGAQAVVSTYRDAGSTPRDCKIEAALVAKTVMADSSYGIKRVYVQFHEPIGTSDYYQEVVVTLPEIKAFATGASPQQEFLDSLRVEQKAEQFANTVGADSTRTENRITSAQPVALPNASAAANETGKEKDANPGHDDQHNKSDQTDNVPSKGAKGTGTAIATASLPAAVARPTFTSRRTGISFKVPLNFVVEEMPSGGTIFKVKDKTKHWSWIELRVDPYQISLPPYARARLKRKEFTYPGASIEQYAESTQFGSRGYPGAFVICNYAGESNRRQTDMNLFFGSGYQLWGWYYVGSGEWVRDAWNEIVSSIAFPKAAPGSTSSQQKRTSPVFKTTSPGKKH